MHVKITILPGDGIGPEVTAQAERVLRTVEEFDGHEFEIAHHAIGGAAIASTGSPLPRETLEACLASDAVLLGAVGLAGAEALPPAERPEAGLLALREALGAFANLRPAVAYEPLTACSPLRPEVVAGADLLIVRELLGGLYYGTPRGVEVGAERVEAFNTMRYSEAEIERVARVAFEAARGRRRRLASVDKANVLETSRLWREVVARVARDYPDVAVEHLFVDACAMHVVTNPTRFDVLLTENLFGDILSDEAAAIVGSLGMLPSASIGGSVGLYEPVHGSAPDLAGRNIANPLGAIASAAMLLRHSAGLEREAQDVEEAIRMVLAAGYATADLDADRGWRTVSTEEMGDLVVQAVAELADARYAWHAV